MRFPRIHSPLHLTHAEAVKTAWAIMGLLIVFEAGAAFHFYTERDVVTAAVIAIGWGKEAIRTFLEHLLEG